MMLKLKSLLNMQLKLKAIMEDQWILSGHWMESDGQIYIVQARPETVKSRQSSQKIERYKLLETSKTIVEGRAIGQKIGTGKTKNN